MSKESKMAKRIKKPLVKPETRKLWLKRFEEDGESAPQIAKADGYDVRTVRKQIDLARQEREAREARFAVLRSALERHHADLVSFAQKLDADIVSASLPMGVRSERLWTALHEHLPRSPLWKLIDRMERLNDELASIDKRAEERMHSEVQKRSPLGFSSKPRDAGYNADGLRGAVVHHLSLEAPWQGKFEVTSVKQQMSEVRYGVWPCAVVPTDQVEAIEKFVAGLIEEISRWPEYEDRKRVLADRRRVTEAIGEELATIILRRIVPGRCKYCPV
jgi:uncharacterized protein (UPF0335 family)